MGSIVGQRSAGRQNNLPSTKTDVQVPERIAEDETKLALWMFLVADLEDRGLYSPTYTFMIQETVETAARLQAARDEVDEEGTTLPRYNRDGDVVGVVPNPAFDQMMKLQASLFKCVAELGLSPRSIVFLQRTDAASFDDPIPMNSEHNESKVVYFR